MWSEKLKKGYIANINNEKKRRANYKQIRI